MRKRLCLHRFPALFALCALAASSAGAGRSVEAPPPTPGAVVVIEKLRDAGGLIASDKGKLPLNEQLTTGMVKYLKDRANGIFAVWDARQRDSWKRQYPQPALILDGELSRVAGVTPEKDTYLLTVRLFLEGTARRIVAQWSGSARSLLYLTNNLKRDTRFSKDGLLGEIGDRVVHTTTAFATPSREDQAKAFVKMIAPLQSSKDFNASILPDAVGLVKVPDLREAPNPMVLVSGMPFVVEVSSTLAGSLYIVTLDENGEIHPLLIPATGSETRIERGKPLRLPTQGSWKARETAKTLRQELILLLHREPATTQLDVGRPRVCMTLQSGGANSPYPGFGLDPDPDVQVVSGGNVLLPRSSTDPELTRLAALVGGDPTQWRIMRVNLSIVPGKKD